MADETEQQPERPEWLQEQFQTPEAQAQAYGEARKEMDRMRSQMEQERAQYAAALDAIQTQAQQQQPAAQTDNGQSFDPYVAQYERAYNEGDVAAMLRIQADAAAQRVIEPLSKAIDDKLNEFRPTLEATQAGQRESQIRMAEDAVARQLGPDKYRELLPSISSLIQDHPHYLPQAASVEGYASAIMDVAKLAEHDTLTKTIADLEQERAEKLQAQTVPSAGIRSAYTKDQQQAEWERIKNAPNDSYGAMMDSR